MLRPISIFPDGPLAPWAEQLSRNLISEARSLNFQHKRATHRLRFGRGS